MHLTSLWLPQPPDILEHTARACAWLPQPPSGTGGKNDGEAGMVTEVSIECTRMGRKTGSRLLSLFIFL